MHLHIVLVSPNTNIKFDITVVAKEEFGQQILFNIQRNVLGQVLCDKMLTHMTPLGLWAPTVCDHANVTSWEIPLMIGKDTLHSGFPKN